MGVLFGLLTKPATMGLNEVMERCDDRERATLIQEELALGESQYIKGGSSGKDCRVQHGNHARSFC